MGAILADRDRRPCPASRSPPPGRRELSAQPGPETSVPHQERLIRTRAERAVAQRRVLPFLVVSIALLSIITGLVARLLDRRDFHTFGDGIWWAIVTFSTVGYGDIVPHTVLGRVLGSLVIVCGVTFLAFLTATVTSLFVAADQAAALAKVHGQREESGHDIEAALGKINERLAAIDAKLGDG
jgi:voltage-gated potassium channel